MWNSVYYWTNNVFDFFLLLFYYYSVNTLDPALIRGDSFAYSGSNMAFKARLMLFFGVTCIAGSLFGSIVILIIMLFF